MNRSSFLSCLLLIFLPGLAQAGSRYLVSGYDNATHRLSMELRFDDAARPRVLVARGAAWGLETQVLAPACGAVPLKEAENGAWQVPAGCRTVSWSVTLQQVADEHYVSAAQLSVVLQPSGLRILSEPSSLLIEQGGAQPAVISSALPSLTLAGAVGLPGGGWRVPAFEEAPEFFVINPGELRSVRAGALQIHYAADDFRRVEALGLLDLHARVIRDYARYLPCAASEASLLVVWIGVDRAQGMIGGAAGGNSFLANYLTGADKDLLALHRNLLVVAHEQFHQLVSACRGSKPSLPAWANESLAQYFALRTVSAGADEVAMKPLVNDFIHSEAAVSQGLLAMNREYRAGRYEVTSLFYRQGATFWHELDGLLRQSGRFPAGLEGLVGELVRMDFQQDGALPEAFLREIESGEGGPEIRALLERYVGR